MMSQLYQIPKYYELVFGDRDFGREAKFIAEVIRKYSKIKSQSILDIACGTGPHMVELAKLGFEVAGLDLSAEMLNEAKTRLLGNSKLIGLYRKNMASFRLSRKFDACVCMVNSLEILTQNEQFISHFNSVANCLNKDGVYFIELDNPSFILSNSKSKTKKYFKHFSLNHEKIKLIYIRYPFDSANLIENSKLVMEVEKFGKKFKIIDDSPVRRLTLQDLKLFTKFSKRLEIIDVLGDFNFYSAPSDTDSKKMIVVLKRVK